MVARAEAEAAANKARQNHDSGRDAAPNGQCYAPFRNLTGIEARSVSWLWYPYLPAGQISLIGAPGGGGKGLNCAHYAACVTTGRKWPGSDEAPEPGRVFWGEAEDPLEEVVIPRLMAAGADLSKIDFATREEFAAIGDHFRRYLVDNDIRLAVMSPVVSFLGLEDINSELNVRASLERLQASIAGTRCAVLGIGHTNKKHDLRAVERLLGSVAFVNFVRSVLLVGRDQNEPDWFRLAHAKHNLSVKGDDLLYRPVHVGDDPRDQFVRLDWDKPDANIDADALYDRRKADDPDRQPTAREWLVAYLEEHGETLRAQIVLDGESAGHKENTLKQAMKREKRIAWRQDGFNGPVWWQLK